MLQTLEIKISPEVCLKYTSYLEYKSIFEVELNFRLGCRSTKPNTPCSKHKVAEKMSQLSSFQGESNEYQGFLGTWWLKVSPHSDSAVYKQLNYINKVVY